MLNDEQVKNIIQKQTVIFTTCSHLGQPRSIYVTPSRVGKNIIVLSNYGSPIYNPVYFGYNCWYVWGAGAFI